MRTFKEETSNMQRLIALSAALNFPLRKAEETRKEIAKLSLKLKRRNGTK